MIARISIDGWKIREKMKAAPEKYSRLREILPDVPEDPAQLYDFDAIVDVESVLPELMALGIEPTIKAFKNGMFLGLTEKIRHLEDSQKLLRQQIYQDGIVAQVHIPNVGMYLINEVDVLEDACTRTLQSHLDDGWRILCVCPPNGQRRPDYIIGRCSDGPAPTPHQR